MDQVLRQKLTQLTTKCDILARSSKYTECIDISEEIVALKKELFGMDHPEFDKASEKLCQYLNLASMLELQQQKFELSLQHLKKAELVARNSSQFKSTTYNNLACYYRRTGKVRTALAYLIQALELELKMDSSKALADTHLNLCAVLSQLDRHEDALQHVMLSIILLQDQFLRVTLPRARGEEGEQQISDQRLAVLAIAYHNLGVQFEHLKRFEQSLKIYRKALSISQEYLGTNEQLIGNLTKVVNSATANLEDNKRHSDSRRQKERQIQDHRKNIYSDFARQVDRLKNLPKLKALKGSQATQLNTPSQEPMSRTDKSFSHSHNHPQDRFYGQSLERGFASRRRPRYYKSHAVTPATPSNDAGSSLADASQTESYIKSRIPVSEGLMDFNG